MKVLLVAALAIISSTAMSADLPNVCYKKAAKAVVTQSGREYDKGGVDAIVCEITANKAAIICEVDALKGDGAASDSYIVVLNKSCTKVLRVQLTGEE